MIIPLEESTPSSFCYLSPTFRLPPPPPPPPLPPIPIAAPPCVVPVAAIPLPPLTALPPPVVDCARELHLSQSILSCEEKEENSPAIAEKATIPAVSAASAALIHLQPEELSAAETLVLLSEEARIVKNVSSCKSYTPIFHRSPVAAAAPSAAPILTTEQLKQIVLDLEKSAREREQQKQDANRQSNASLMKSAESMEDESNMSEPDKDEMNSDEETTNMAIDPIDVSSLHPVALTTSVDNVEGRPIEPVLPNQDKAFLEEFFIDSPFHQGGMRMEESNSSAPQSMEVEEPIQYMTKDQFEQEFNKFAHTIDSAKEALLSGGANCDRIPLPVTFFRAVLASTAAAIATQLWTQSKGDTNDNPPAPDSSTAADAAAESVQPSSPAAAQSIPDQATCELNERQSRYDAFTSRQKERHEARIRTVLAWPSRISPDPAKHKSPAQPAPLPESPIIDVDGSWEEEPSDDEKEHDKTVEYRLDESTDAAVEEEKMPVLCREDCGSVEFVSHDEVHGSSRADNGDQAPPLDATPPETRSPSAEVSSIFDLMSIDCPPRPTQQEEGGAPPPHGALTPPSENDGATAGKPNLQELEEMGASPCIVCYKMLWRSERNAHLVMEHGLRGVKKERLTKERRDADEGKKCRGYRCPRCPETFWSYEDVDKHVYYHHENDYRPRCFTCGDEFRVMTDLVEHIRKEHTE